MTAPNTTPDPATDPIGTVRRTKDGLPWVAGHASGGTLSSWRWYCPVIDARAAFQIATDSDLAGSAVIGAMPGTPAASEVAASPARTNAEAGSVAPFPEPAPTYASWDGKTVRVLQTLSLILVETPKGRRCWLEAGDLAMDEKPADQDAEIQRLTQDLKAQRLLAKAHESNNIAIGATNRAIAQERDALSSLLRGMARRVKVLRRDNRKMAELIPCGWCDGTGMTVNPGRTGAAWMHEGQPCPDGCAAPAGEQDSGPATLRMFGYTDPEPADVDEVEDQNGNRFVRAGTGWAHKSGCECCRSVPWDDLIHQCEVLTEVPADTPGGEGRG